MEKKITVQRRECTVSEYERFGYRTIMVVKTSNHPKYKSNTRFDYGNLELANKDGYTVEFLPTI